MKSRFEEFLSLHHSTEPLLIANVWNAQSAKAFEQAGYKALATSSAAVAETLGYQDGEQMRFEEYWFVIKSIVRNSSLPVSVDLESGYGKDVEDVIENIRQLASIGIAGINIEDSKIINGKRELTDAGEFTDRLEAILKGLATTNTKMFINVRCDTFLLGVPSAVEESKRRGERYTACGVHGLFFPCIIKEEEIAVITKGTSLPVNVMCMPDLPNFTVLQSLGVKRISMGNFVNKKLYGDLEKLTIRVKLENSFKSVF